MEADDEKRETSGDHRRFLKNYSAKELDERLSFDGRPGSSSEELSLKRFELIQDLITGRDIPTRPMQIRWV